ncbi:phage tail-like protein [Hamadaea flava]|uniref:Phage tail protein n=1 Tax=Hamadaea flava TaxID=1742688 RepID=A0ABV8LT06_9ACTN|nr:phage tail protein [Hamadaea flava]MCP2327987.1 phage tail-like protein [Hamadaea flava]
MRRAAIERLLPAAYQRAAVPGSVLSALLDAMETLHEPDERLLADVDSLFSAYRTSEALAAYLTRWVALDQVITSPSGARLPIRPGDLRNLVAIGAHLAQWRGTPYGMRRALEVATGVPGFTVVEPADRPFHLIVRVPPAAADRLALVTRLVSVEKPAATTFEVVVEPALPPIPTA